MPIVRLGIEAKIAIRDLYEGCERDDDDNIVSDADKLRFAVEFVALSVVNAEQVLEFDSVDGREWLGTQDTALAELLPPLCEFNDFGAATEKELDESLKRLQGALSTWGVMLRP